jgi:hypothetical protein
MQKDKYAHAKTHAHVHAQRESKSHVPMQREKNNHEYIQIEKKKITHKCMQGMQQTKNVPAC